LAACITSAEVCKGSYLMQIVPSETNKPVEVRTSIALMIYSSLLVFVLSPHHWPVSGYRQMANLWVLNKHALKYFLTFENMAPPPKSPRSFWEVTITSRAPASAWRSVQPHWLLTASATSISCPIP